jgi:hypothetical protein
MTLNLQAIWRLEIHGRVVGLDLSKITLPKRRHEQLFQPSKLPSCVILTAHNSSVGRTIQVRTLRYRTWGLKSNLLVFILAQNNSC